MEPTIAQRRARLKRDQGLVRARHLFLDMSILFSSDFTHQYALNLEADTLLLDIRQKAKELIVFVDELISTPHSHTDLSYPNDAPSNVEASALLGASQRGPGAGKNALKGSSQTTIRDSPATSARKFNTPASRRHGETYDNEHFGSLDESETSPSATSTAGPATNRARLGQHAGNVDVSHPNVSFVQPSIAPMSLAPRPGEASNEAPGAVVPAVLLPIQQEFLSHTAGTPLSLSNQSTQRKTSQYRGVCLERRCNKWKAAIKINGIHKHLGYFDNEEDAHRAYLKAAQEKLAIVSAQELSLS